MTPTELLESLERMSPEQRLDWIERFNKLTVEEIREMRAKQPTPEPPAAPSPFDSATPKQPMVCTLCGGRAELSSGVWRHADKPPELVICDRYGYPIEVKPAPPSTVDERPAEARRTVASIYTASKTRHADKWKELRSRGLPINSTWIDEAGPGESASLSDLWIRCIQESASADVLIAYCEDGDVLKGGFVEVGSALASGKRVFAVGFPSTLSVLSHPLVSAFYTLNDALRELGYPQTESGE